MKPKKKPTLHDPDPKAPPGSAPGRPLQDPPCCSSSFLYPDHAHSPYHEPHWATHLVTAAHRQAAALERIASRLAAICDHLLDQDPGPP